MQARYVYFHIMTYYVTLFKDHLRLCFDVVFLLLLAHDAALSVDTVAIETLLP